VLEVTVTELRRDMDKVVQVTTSFGVDLIVALDGGDKFRSQLITYAGPAMAPGLPPTLYAGIDRRKWRRDHERTTIRSTILFIGGDQDNWDQLMASLPGLIQLGEHGDAMHLLTDNASPTAELLVRAGRPLD
jgi:hypothetical protein